MSNNSESFPNPDLDPAVEYAFLVTEAREALQRACAEDAAAAVSGAHGTSLALAAGYAELRPGDKRLVLLTDYSGSDGDTEWAEEPERIMQVFGGMDAQPGQDKLFRLQLKDTGYAAHNDPINLQARDADVYDCCRQLLRTITFDKALAEDMLHEGLLKGSLGEPTVDMGPAPQAQAAPEALTSASRRTRAGDWLARIFRRNGRNA